MSYYRVMIEDSYDARASWRAECSLTDGKSELYLITRWCNSKKSLRKRFEEAIKRFDKKTQDGFRAAYEEEEKRLACTPQ